MTDPMTQDDQAVLDRQDDDFREQRWAQFVAWLQARRTLARTWSPVLDDATRAYWQMHRISGGDIDELTDFQRPFAEFADEHGWPSMFAAIARAMREVERDQAQQTDPRRV